MLIPIEKPPPPSADSKKLPPALLQAFRNPQSDYRSPTICGAAPATAAVAREGSNRMMNLFPTAARVREGTVIACANGRQATLRRPQDGECSRSAADAPGRHSKQGLRNDVATHLGLADSALGERDGRFHHAQTVFQRAPEHVDREAVSVAGDTTEFEAPQGIRREHPVSTGGVTHTDAEGRPRVGAPAETQQFAPERPVLN